MLWSIAKDWNDPFESMRHLQRHINRFFENGGYRGEDYPLVNLYGNEEEIVVEAEIPGIKPENIDVSIDGNYLKLEGERKLPERDKEGTWHMLEREAGRFSRTFKLPFEAESTKVAASYKEGILKVFIPRAEVSKPKKINISCS